MTPGQGRLYFIQPIIYLSNADIEKVNKQTNKNFVWLWVIWCVWGVSQDGRSSSSGSIHPVRSDQPGGRRIATWLGSCTVFHRVWEVLWTSWYGTMDIFCSCSVGEIPAAMWSGRTVQLRSRWAFVSLFAPVFLQNVGADGNLSSSWNASVSANGSVTAGWMTVAH